MLQFGIANKIEPTKSELTNKEYANVCILILHARDTIYILNGAHFKGFKVEKLNLIC